MKGRVVLSFDYELFFGDNAGSINKTLIEPTNRILDALDSINGKAVFFVDYLMLERMRVESEKTKSEAIIIEDQLREIVRRGSRIELHLHPHWLDAVYRAGEWDFSNFDHYCLNSLPKEKIIKLFVDGVDYLTNIAKDVDPSYKIDAFRAGGWAVLPFKMMSEGFRKAGLYIDSSVTSKMLINGYTHSVDFRRCPEKPVYQFGDDVLSVDPNGDFYEVQISSYYMGVFERIVSSLYRRIFKSRYMVLTDGTHRQKKRDMASPHSFSESRWKGKMSSFSINESIPFFMMLRLFFRKDMLTVFIGHPKDFNMATIHNIELIAKYAEYKSYQDILS